MKGSGITCCNGCTERHKLCHSTCKEYAEEKAENGRKREEHRKFNRAVLDYRYEKNSKIKRKLKR